MKFLTIRIPKLYDSDLLLDIHGGLPDIIENVGDCDNRDTQIQSSRISSQRLPIMAPFHF